MNRDHELPALFAAKAAARTEEERMPIGRKIATICRGGIEMDEDEQRCESRAAAWFEDAAYGRDH